MKKIITFIAVLAAAVCMSAQAADSDGSVKYRIEIKSIDGAGVSTVALDSTVTTMPDISGQFSRKTQVPFLEHCEVKNGHSLNALGTVDSGESVEVLSVTVEGQPSLTNIKWAHDKVLGMNKVATGDGCAVETPQRESTRSQKTVRLQPGMPTLIDTVPSESGGKTELRVTLLAVQ